MSIARTHRNLLYLTIAALLVSSSSFTLNSFATQAPASASHSATATLNASVTQDSVRTQSGYCKSTTNSTDTQFNESKSGSGYSVSAKGYLDDSLKEKVCISLSGVGITLSLTNRDYFNVNATASNLKNAKTISIESPFVLAINSSVSGSLQSKLSQDSELSVTIQCNFKGSCTNSTEFSCLYGASLDNLCFSANESSVNQRGGIRVAFGPVFTYDLDSLAKIKVFPNFFLEADGGNATTKTHIPVCGTVQEGTVEAPWYGLCGGIAIIVSVKIIGGGSYNLQLVPFSTLLAGSMAVYPHNVTLKEGGTQLFTAIVAGDIDLNGTWAIVQSDCGTLSQSVGVNTTYTAPERVTTCTIQANTTNLLFLSTGYAYVNVTS